MKNIHSYHIINFKDDWCVRKAGSVRASSVWGSYKNALKEGKRLAKKYKLLLYIHNKNGRIRRRIDLRGKK